MKGDYTIQDREYLNALTLVCGEFNRRGINYAVIGGGAVQVHLVNTVQEHERLTDLLRKTGDIDIVVDSSLDEMIAVFNELAVEGKATYAKKGKPRVGHVSINYLTEGSLKGVDHGISLGETETIRLSGTPVKVETPEMIIVAKLTGSFKPKDRHDIDALHYAFGEKLDEEKIRALLTARGKPEKFQVYQSLTG